MPDPPEQPRPDRSPGWVWLMAVVLVSLLLWAMLIWGGVTLYRRIAGVEGGHPAVTTAIGPVR